ncbi:flavin-containing monooxygenase [Spongisporangium articulatum]|uniref:Flavin-containing monooxygenase n=1 Tax=Spongisporangium articulatum TaxID=3362603 RepID=A0ABW8AMK0_9ACTN
MPPRDLSVLIIGAGAGGLAAAAAMRRDGVRDLTVVEQAGEVGGVWAANTYPGAQCDVPSHLYSLSFRPNPRWSRTYGDGPEILENLRDVVRAHGLEPYLRLRTTVRRARWDDGGWLVELDHPEEGLTEVRADVVIAATGQLSRPAVPALDGLESFSGQAFHSADWPAELDLNGKRVAVVGTGASAVQFVPRIVEAAQRVTVFQRSAPYIVGKADRPYREWEKAAYARVPGLLRLSRLRQYLWNEMLGLGFVKYPVLMRFAEVGWRLRLLRAVRDRSLRRKLTPDYRMGCKRILRAPDWYRTLVRPDVDLVTEPISGVTPEGVRTADGALHEADVLIFGTGFETTDFLAPIEITGPDGVTLAERWRDGATAYLGTVVAGFPNLFTLYGPGTNLGNTSILLMIEAQLGWVRQALRRLRSGGAETIEVRPEVQQAYLDWFHAASAGTIWETGCRSWYLVDGHNVNNWPDSAHAFRRRLRRLDPADLIS